MRLRRPSKAQRRAALAAILDGVPDPPELPEAEGISMIEDDAVLVGDRWVKPSDYDDDDTQHNRLPMLKGTTPLTLPTLADDDTTGSEPCESD